MSSHASNPAGRLLLFFRFVEGRSSREPFHTSISAYFSIQDAWLPKYWNAFGTLWTSTSDLERDVSAVEDPDAREVYQRPFAPIRQLLTSDPVGGNDRTWVMSQIHPGLLSDLEHASLALRRLSADPVIDGDTLKRIRDLAAEIIDLAESDATLAAEVRVSVIRYAQRIAEAAVLYKVAGTAPLMDELDRFQGALKHTTGRPSGLLKDKVIELTGSVLMAVALLTAPSDIGAAVESYSALLELPSSIQAPAPQLP